MGNKNSGKRIYNVNDKFFREWSPNMAYILGFTCADGCIYQRTLSWELSNKFASDKLLLERFSKELDSTYKVEERRRSFRLRINSSLLLISLRKFGIVQNKTKILAFPNVPNEFLRHFIRGFLDGDGWISMRNRRESNEINLGFVNGSKSFMMGLIDSLKMNTAVTNINLRVKNKFSKNGIYSTYYNIERYSKNAYEVIKYLYDNLTDKDLFLTRKYEKQTQARLLFSESQKIVNLGKKWAKIEREEGINVKNELVSLFNQGNILPKEMATRLNVSLATIYRWLEKTNLRIPATKGSLEWRDRIFKGTNVPNRFIEAD